MPQDVVVIADINLDTKSVTLTGMQTRPPLKSSQTFLVENGDTLKWVFRDAPGTTKRALGAFRPRIRFVNFVPFPKLAPAEAAEKDILLAGGVTDGKTFDANDNNVIEGAVRGAAPRGGYQYAVELVSKQAPMEPPIELVCFWSESAGGNVTPTPDRMGGGEKGPRL